MTHWDEDTCGTSALSVQVAPVGTRLASLLSLGKVPWTSIHSREAQDPVSSQRELGGSSRPGKGHPAESRDCSLRRGVEHKASGWNMGQDRTRTRQHLVGSHKDGQLAQLNYRSFARARRTALSHQAPSPRHCQHLPPCPGPADHPSLSD